MILTDLFESPEIHNRPKLDAVLARCIELIHEKNAANPKNYGRVAACIIDMKNRKVFGINSPGADGRRRHAERVAIDAYHKRYGKILPGAIIVTTLSPCNRDMLERDGPSCQDLLLQVGIEKVYSGYMDPSQHSEHPFTEETTKNDDLWRQCKEFSDSFVHDDLTEGKVKLYTDPGHYGAELDNYKATGPVVNIPADQLVGFEPDSKMQQPKSRANVEKIIAGLEKGDKLPPLLVRKHKDGYQILDGHHRFRAYKLSGTKIIPAQIVPDSDIEEIGKQDVAENFADGKGPGRPGDSQRHGIPKGATMAELEKASHAKGRKGQLARWQLNMRRGRKKTNEVTVGVLNLGEFAINVDDHAFERAQQRKINLADIDAVLRKIKLPRVIKKIMDIDVGNRFYVLDHVTDVALGFRRIGDKKLVLKTVYSGRPMDLNIAGIITV